MIPFALWLACEQSRPSSPTTPATDKVADSHAQAGQGVPATSPAPTSPAPTSPAPTSPAAVNDLHPDVVATLTRWTLVRRVLADGGLTKAGREVLVVQRDGTAEIHDGDVDGPVIRRATVDKKTVVKLEAIVARADWKSLPEERGTEVPDGPVAQIAAAGRHVKRFDNADDEPIFREARAILNAIWDLADR